MTPDRLPLPLRSAVFGSAVAVLLWLTLAPSRDLPQVSFWDKGEHALAFLVLAGLGLVLFPRHPVRMVVGVTALGALIEILQATMDLGRDGDWRDLAADVVGVAAALLLFALARRALRR